MIKRAIIALVILGFMSPMPVQAFKGGGGPAPVSSGPSVPAPAAAWGFNTLPFDDEFDSISSIDVNNTLAPGFKWYVQSYLFGTHPNQLYVVNSASFSVSSGVLTYNPNNCSPSCGVTGGNIYSVGWVPGSPPTYVGNTIQPTGFYAEARIAYDPSLAPASGNRWFPAFWLWDKSILLKEADSLSYGGAHYTEFDVFEATPNGGGGSVEAQYVDWDWYQPSGTTTQKRNTNYALAVPTIDAGFHTYGLLWVPMVKNGGTGLIQRYVDGVLISAGNVTYTSTTASPTPNGGYATGWMAGADSSTQGFSVNLQTGNGWPMQIDYVRVWQ